jgi:hypothetical protein
MLLILGKLVKTDGCGVGRVTQRGFDLWLLVKNRRGEKGCCVEPPGGADKRLRYQRSSGRMSSFRVWLASWFVTEPMVTWSFVIGGAGPSVLLPSVSEAETDA